MATNPRRRQHTESQDDNVPPNQIHERGVLLQISNKLWSVIEKLDKISSLLESKKHEELITTEFEETRQLIQSEFSTITTYAISANNILLQKDKEILKVRIK